MQFSSVVVQHQQASGASARPPIGITYSWTGSASLLPQTPPTMGALRKTARDPVRFT